MRPGAERMVGAHADVGHSNALGQVCWVDPHHAQGPALSFRRGDLVGSCVWAETGEGSGCRDSKEEGEIGERFHVGVGSGDDLIEWCS